MNANYRKTPTLLPKVLWFLAGVGVLLALGAGLFVIIAANQGLRPSEFARYHESTVTQDSLGTYEINAVDWSGVVKTQGFIVGSERLFQMDLMRRRASGGLAELFGSAAVPHDESQVRQDWQGVAERAVELLPSMQREACEAYAAGVNDFIANFPNRWGLEYQILRSEPKPWSCRDSLLIVMSMADSMSNHLDGEAASTIWHAALPDSWWKFFHITSHPWNVPLFPGTDRHIAQLPNKTEWLPAEVLSPLDFAAVNIVDDRTTIGSNSWAYRGSKGAWLANDPHLSYQVPQLWVAMRLKTADGSSTTGSALPGLPGVLIGMNQHLAWSITNTQEDVDDLLLEELSDDGTQYVAEVHDGKKIWNKLESFQKTIKIKGAADRLVTVRKTRRGPLVEQELFPGRQLSRQWIGLHPEFVGIPTIELNQAKNFAEFNAALDMLRIVALNFTMLDTLGNIGYRTSGVGVLRSNLSNIVQPAIDGEWVGMESTSMRRRLFLPVGESKSSFLVTANQRLWLDDKMDHWADDDRAARVREVLSASADLSIDDMQSLQLDTTSHFHKRVIDWLVKYGDTSLLGAEQLHSWQVWQGNGRTDSRTMTDAITAVGLLRKIMHHRVSRAFDREHHDLPPLKREMSRATILLFIDQDDGPRAFGLNPTELVNAIMTQVARKGQSEVEDYFMSNRWSVQHPFVGRIPVIGQFFAIRELPQYGFGNTVRAESPNKGPSMRMIWEPKRPENSRWAFPVGQSGHAWSGFYSNLQNGWAGGKMVLVF